MMNPYAGFVVTVGDFDCPAYERRFLDENRARAERMANTEWRKLVIVFLGMPVTISEIMVGSRVR